MSRYTEGIRLTDREYEVLRLVALGLSAKEAALELDIAPCRTRNRAHLIAHVIREGLLPQDRHTADIGVAAAY
jgi:LuxR family transcriptional regulator of spore coat protein